MPPPTATADLIAIEVGGATLAYADPGGSGEPVLLLHAGVFASWFDQVASDPALGGLRVVTTRRAGYVDGAPPPTGLSVSDHAAHAAAVIEALGAGPAHVVGHSSGSVIALQLALDRPDLVRTLVLGEPPLTEALVDPVDLDLVRSVIGPTVGGAIAAAAGDLPTSFDRFMTAICGPDHRTVLLAHLGPDGLARAERESAYFFSDEAGAVARWSLDETAASGIEVPVLLVEGGASPPPVRRLVARWAAALPKAEVATVAGDDHLLPLRSAPTVARLVADFTSSHR